MKRLLPLFLTLSLLTGCTAGVGVLRPILTPEGSAAPVGTVICAADTPLVNLYDDYALDLLRACRKEGENTLLSPLSISLALGMTANGAAGDTLAEFESLFGMDLATLNSLSAQFMADYAALGGSTQASIANSLWVDPWVTLEEDFSRRCADPYAAQLYHVDFRDPGTVKAINGWVSEATRGLIPSVVDRLDPEAVMALINAIYLKNQFQWPFATPSSDWEMDFTAADGTLSRPKGMSNGTRNEEYISTGEGSGVLLPYDDGRLGLLVMLPREGLSLTDYLSSWDGSTLPGLLAARESTLVRLTMPKFKAEWSGSLKEVLQGLGMTNAFDEDTADFTPMGHLPDVPEASLYIGDVIHKTAFEVNEKGTEAAAVTAVIMMAPTSVAAPPPQPVILTLDRPFVYSIVDLDTATPLFLGTAETLP